MKVTIITMLKMISGQLEEMLELWRSIENKNDERYQEQLDRQAQFEEKIKEKQAKWAKEFEAQSNKNIDAFVAGLKGGLKEGGITDLAEEAKRRKAEEDEWRKKVLRKDDST